MFAQCKVFLLELYTGDLVSRKSRQDSFFPFLFEAAAWADSSGNQPVQQTFIERAY